MDLMDFTSQPDGIYHWVLQLKDHFSRMIWLFPLRDKSSEEVASSLRTWIAWCGQPKSFYSDNGKEFAGEVTDLLANQVTETFLISMVVRIIHEHRVVLRWPIKPLKFDFQHCALNEAFHGIGYPYSLSYKK
jgi:hypothetical protein